MNSTRGRSLPASAAMRRSMARVSPSRRLPPPMVTNFAMLFTLRLKSPGRAGAVMLQKDRLCREAGGKAPKGLLYAGSH